MGRGFFCAHHQIQFLSGVGIPPWGAQRQLTPRLQSFGGLLLTRSMALKSWGAFFFFFFLRCWAEFKPSMDMDPLSLPPGSFSYTWVQGVDISITRLQWDYCHLPSFLHL